MYQTSSCCLQTKRHNCEVTACRTRLENSLPKVDVGDTASHIWDQGHIKKKNTWLFLPKSSREKDGKEGLRPLSNNVLLVKIEGSVWYTIYHHLPVVKGVCEKPLY